MTTSQQQGRQSAAPRIWRKRIALLEIMADEQAETARQGEDAGRRAALLAGAARRLVIGLDQTGASSTPGGRLAILPAIGSPAGVVTR